MVSSLGLGDETFVAVNNDQRGLLNFPFADIRESFGARVGLLGCLRRCPAVCPVLGELFDERSLDFSRLDTISALSWIAKI